MIPTRLNDRDLIQARLRSHGIKRPILVERTTEGLDLRDPDLCRRLGSQSKYCLVDDDRSIRWLVHHSQGTVCIYQ